MLPPYKACLHGRPVQKQWYAPLLDFYKLLLKKSMKGAQGSDYNLVRS